MISTDADRFGVLPVSLEPSETADEWSELISGAANPLGFAVAVLVQHRFSLPLRTFDANVGRLSTDVYAAVTVARSNYKHDTSTPSDTPAIHSVLDPRLEAQEEMVEDFVVLTGAHWEVQIAASEEPDWALLAQVQTIEPDRIYELVNGAAPTPDEVSQAGEAGVRLARSEYDRGLVSFLEKPANSSRLRRSGRALPDAALFTVAADYLTERQYATAARGASDAEWERLFEEFLNAE